ncbi:MAG TPA: 16S rRNA (guanine(966)-N(2))-methyltransferase RsmD [Burkholderiales bacterium]|nr:16S rRNA (guanine(966)-N(2))-methyltransferase RsmD [Burkholderiales bacterium]
MRIIGGRFRGRVIHFPSRQKLRPTPARVRETLFNWLGQDLTGKACLDLFAGSGALGFEAASRGARCVVMVEADRAAFLALEATRAKLNAATVRLVWGDAVQFLERDQGKYDVLLIDPPYGSAVLPEVARLFPPRAAEEARLYIETGDERALAEVLQAGIWEIHRKTRAGAVNAVLLARRCRQTATV